MTTLDKLYLTPTSAGYAITPPSDAVIRNIMDGGAGAYSAEFENGSRLVDLAFQMTRAEWQYMEAFFRNRTGNEAEPFLIDLVLDGAPTAEYTVYLIPASRKLDASRGALRFVSMQLEVLPADVDDDFDSAVVEVFEAGGSDTLGYLDLFAEVIAALPGR